MTLATLLKKIAHMLPLVFMVAANDTSAAPPSSTIELDQLDFSKTIDGCFVTNQKGTAYQKLMTALDKQKQIIFVESNQAVKSHDNPLQAQFFSITGNGLLGYDISMQVPKDRREETPVACLYPLTNAHVYNVYTLPAVPDEVNKGELGEILRNSHESHLKVMMTAESFSGTLRALSFNSDRNGGVYTSAGKEGNKAGNLGHLTDMDYTPVAKELLRRKGNSVR